MKKQDLLQLPEGHPVDYYIRENSALELILNNLQMALENGGHDDKVQLAMARLKKIRALYGKKEELIMAPLERYGITGPSEVMWGVDDEIKAEVGRLARGPQNRRRGAEGTDSCGDQAHARDDLQGREHPSADRDAKPYG